MTGQVKNLRSAMEFALDAEAPGSDCIHPNDQPVTNRLAQIQQRIKNGYYNNENVITDISDKLGNILGDYE